MPARLLLDGGFDDPNTGLSGTEEGFSLIDGHEGTRGVPEVLAAPTPAPAAPVGTARPLSAGAVLLPALDPFRSLETAMSWMKTGGGSTGSPKGRFPVPLGPPLPVTKI